MGGVLTWPLEHAEAAFRAYRDLYVGRDDDRLSLYLVLPTDPYPARREGAHGLRHVRRRPDERGGAPGAAPIRCGRCSTHSVPRPTYDLQQMLGEEIVYGMQLKWRGGYFRDGGFGDEAFGRIVDAFQRIPSGYSMARFDLLGGGAIAAVPADATAFVHRAPLFNISIIALWVRDDETEANLAWTDDVCSRPTAVPVRRGLPELRRRGSCGLADRLLRRQLPTPAAGQARVRPDRLLPARAEHSSRVSVSLWWTRHGRQR